MRKFFFFLFAFIFFFYARQTYAIYDPLSVPNNKLGIHILFTSEAQKAKDLVNTSGGDWGYVTIPIQAGDKDLIKWQSFFDECRELHLIPILRLATEGDYFDKTTWRKGKETDIVDFANFLSSLNWPTKNRYIIVFNEVNRADEWQGKSDPSAYASLLSYAVTVFKSKNRDFFIISAGLDNAARSDGRTYNEYDFLESMDNAIPGIFNQIDGFSSHAYPNPGFIQSPSVLTPQSISSYSYEEELIDSLSNKKLPIFITETGWDQSKITQNDVGNYFKIASANVWNDPRIVAITPFLFSSGPGPFQKFSFIDQNGNPNEVYKAYLGIHKVAGRPPVNPVKKVLGINVVYFSIPIKSFQNLNLSTQGLTLRKFTHWFLFGL